MPVYKIRWFAAFCWQFKPLFAVRFFASTASDLRHREAQPKRYILDSHRAQCAHSRERFAVQEKQILRHKVFIDQTQSSDAVRTIVLVQRGNIPQHETVTAWAIHHCIRHKNGIVHRQDGQKDTGEGEIHSDGSGRMVRVFQNGKGRYHVWHIDSCLRITFTFQNIITRSLKHYFMWKVMHNFSVTFHRPLFFIPFPVILFSFC